MLRSMPAKRENGPACAMLAMLTRQPKSSSPAPAGQQAIDHGREGHLGVVGAVELQQQLHVVEARVVVGRVGGHRVLQLLERALGVALGQRLLRRLFLGGGLGLVGTGHVLVEEFADLLGGNGADEAVDRLAVLEHHAERDAAHAEHLGELGGDRSRPISRPMHRTVALLVFSGVQSLDVSGPMDVFSEANRFLPSEDHYRLETIGVEHGTMPCSNGLSLQAHRHYAEVDDAFDLLLVAGGPALVRQHFDRSA